MVGKTIGTAQHNLFHCKCCEIYICSIDKDCAVYIVEDVNMFLRIYVIGEEDMMKRKMGKDE